MNNVKKSIGWADLTWNPVTGCKRGCSYCYARRIHERFNKTPFSDIYFHPSRLYDSDLWKKPPSKIFVGSMSDIAYWDKGMVEAVLDVCKTYRKHTFMFLSKSPEAYKNYTWPPNTMQGLTLEMCSRIEDHYGITLFVSNAPRPFLSFEPLLGRVVFSSAFALMEKIIVGAMTGPGAKRPKSEWIRWIKEIIPEEKIFWKSNIRRYL